MRGFSMLTFLLFQIVVFAQQKGQNVSWVTGLNWNEVKKMANLQNKLIFVDCYATWCRPCHKMDREVYTDSTVGSFINKNFISIRLQYDQTKGDDSITKARYVDVAELQKVYNTTSFPIYLFFSSKGELVHVAEGYKAVPDFLSIAKQAIDPSLQAVTLIRNYKANSRHKQYNLMPKMVKAALAMQDTALSERIAEDYIKNYLLGLPAEALFTRDNLTLITKHMKSSSDRVFRLFIDSSAWVDKTFGSPGYADFVVKYMIRKEIIQPIVDRQKSFDKISWTKMEMDIEARFGKNYNAKKLVMEAKITQAKKEERWNLYAIAFIEKIKNYGIDTFNKVQSMMEINDASWNIFLHIDDRKMLNDAASIMDKYVNSQIRLQEFIDTYANIIYKLGDKSKAIAIEIEALQLAEAAAKKNNTAPDSVFQQTLDKMKSNIPTWK